MAAANNHIDIKHGSTIDIAHNSTTETKDGWKRVFVVGAGAGCA